MDHERKELLAQKKAQLKKRQKRAEIQQYKDRLTKSIEHFSQKYRYADEAEALKIETFISKLNFEQPGQLAIQEVCPYPHGNVYLCSGPPAALAPAAPAPRSTWTADPNTARTAAPRPTRDRKSVV